MRQLSGIVLSTIILWNIFSIISCNVYGCMDSLRDEQGRLLLRDWPQKAGVDYKENEILIETKVGALELPKEYNEAYLYDCNISMNLRMALEEYGAYYFKKYFPIEKNSIRLEC